MGKWVEHLAWSNIKKHGKRNIFSIASLIVGLSASFVIIGFSNGAEPSIKNECYKQFDYGSLSITKESKSESTNGGLSIIRNTRPLLGEIKDINNDYLIDLNFDAIVPNYSTITYGKNELKDFTYECVYSFIGNYVDKELLVEGKYPKEDSLNEVLINEKAEKDFAKQNKITPIGSKVKIHYEIDYPYHPDDSSKAINDYFVYDQEAKIVGVVKDLSFLSTPKIYYPYISLKKYLSQIYLNNLSEYLNANYSWIERINDCNGADSVSAYSYRLFLKNYQKVNEIESLINNTKKPLSINSNCETRTTALLGLVKAATTGMELFLIIALVGTALIMGIVSFSFYSEDKKVIAILSCVGAKMDDINDIYCLENMMIGLISFLISIILSPLLQILINSIVKNISGFIDIIDIPFRSFLNIPFGLPIIVFLSTVVVSVFATLLPIVFSKKISLKEELKDE